MVGEEMGISLVRIWDKTSNCAQESLSVPLSDPRECFNERELSPVRGTHCPVGRAVARSKDDPSLRIGDTSSPPPPPLRETLGLHPACPTHLESSRPFCHNSALEKCARRGELWYLIPSINVNPSFPATPTAWYIYLKAE